MLLSKIKAFSLIELMVTVAIAGILAAVAAPSFANIIKNNSMTTQYNELLASLNLARSEAIRRGVPVNICKSNDQTNCGNNTVNWQDGWIVFADTVTVNGTRDGGEELIRVHDALPISSTLDYSQANVRYDIDGAILGNSNLFFTMCDSRGNDYRKGLHVSATGRVRHTNSMVGLASC
jgi:type IV fimbrial biogenesis protein FimT